MPARMRRAFAAALCLFAVAAAPASAAQPDCTGRGVPVNKISIQEYTFAGFLGSSTGDAARAKLGRCSAFLRDTGYRNIELYTLNGLPATEVRALLDEYGIKASARHVDVGTPAAPATSTRSSRRTRSSASRTSAQARRRATTPPKPSGSPTRSTSTRSASGPARPARR